MYISQKDARRLNATLVRKEIARLEAVEAAEKQKAYDTGKWDTYDRIESRLRKLREALSEKEAQHG